MASLSRWIKGLDSSYPNPANWHELGKVPKNDVFRFARLWLCEGIPYAFRQHAGAYELARERFAKILGEHPKNVSMTGSGRLGYSLSPVKFGRGFQLRRSDIDLFLVSSGCFNGLRQDALEFSERVRSGEAQPRSWGEKRYWPENAEVIRRNSNRGFVDQKLVPNADRYLFARKCYIACEVFRRTIVSQMGDEAVAKVSVRVYRDWEAAERQIGGSLLAALREMSILDE